MIISVLNTKGGCGKSTISINIAVGLAHVGLDTLLIDTDPDKGTSIDWSNSRDDDPNDQLTVVQITRPESLKNDVAKLTKKYGAIVIDGAPQLQALLTISTVVSDLVLIPVKPSPNDAWKLGPITDTIKQIRDSAFEVTGKRIDVCFVVNEYIDGTRLGKEISEALSAYDLPVLDSKICSRMDYRESIAQGLAAIHFSNPKAKKEIKALLSEIFPKIGLTKYISKL